MVFDPLTGSQLTHCCLNVETASQTVYQRIYWDGRVMEGPIDAALA